MRWNPWLLLAYLCFCTTSAGATDTVDFVTAATAAGAQLAKQFNPYPLQIDPGTAPVDCRPLVVRADPHVPFRGTAILFHGFGACPNQYTEMAATLAARGVQSFAPPLPGEGRAPVPLAGMNEVVGGVPFAVYYSAFLPTVRGDGVARYAAFVAAVNHFAASLEGPKTIVGFSVGGSLATRAYLEQLGLYQRALILSPFYHAASSYAGQDADQSSPWQTFVRRLSTLSSRGLNRSLVYLAEHVAVVGERAFSWGPTCYQQNAGAPGQMPRRGFCDFQLQHLAAAIAFGQETLDHLNQLDQTAVLPALQIVFSEFDPASETRSIRKAFAVQQRLAGSRAAICLHRAEVGHSFFSRPDLWPVVTDPAWLPPFLRHAADFVAGGAPFPQLPDTVSKEYRYDPERAADSSTHLPLCALEL